MLASDRRERVALTAVGGALSVAANTMGVTMAFSLGDETMRNAVVVGLTSIVVLALSACGSDVQESPSGSTSTAGSGGMGQGGSGGTSASGGMGQGGMGQGGGGQGGMGNMCDQACDKLAVECGFGNVCDMPPVSNVLNCADPQSDCPAQCVLDASCAAIGSLPTNMPDPVLQSCVQACQGGSGGAGGGMASCQTCLTNSCLTELAACNVAQSPCAMFIQCGANCAPGDGACIKACELAHPSKETTAVIQCGTANCASECGLGAGGAGGAGGGN